MHGLVVKIQIASVLGIDGHGGIAQHGLGPGGGHGDEGARQAVHGVADVPQVTGHVGVRHFQIGERGVAARAPVDHVLAAVDQPLLVEAHEDFADGAAEAGIQREALARPVAARAQADHLALNGVAVLRLPFPHARFECLAAHTAARQSLFGLFAFHHHLGGDAGVIGAGQPQRVIAAHAVPAHGDVDFGVLQHVADVQHPGHVRRRNHQREHLARRFGVGEENARVDPPLRPMRLEPLRLVHFVDLHGKVPV